MLTLWMNSLPWRARFMLSFLSLSHPRDILVVERERLIEAGPYFCNTQPPFSRSQGRSKLPLVTGCVWPSISRTSIPVNYWHTAYWKRYERNWLGLIWFTIPVFFWRKRDKPKETLSQDSRPSSRGVNPGFVKCRTGILITRRNVQSYEFQPWRLFSFHAQKAPSLHALGDQRRNFSTIFYINTFSWSNMCGNSRCVLMFRLQKNETDFHGM